LVNPTLTPEEFFETLINEFETGGIASTKLGRLTALNELLLSAQARGSTAVLIVDEAHLLSVEVLEEVRLLTNMETYKEKLLQVILCGQTELSILVQSQKMRALRQRIAVVVHLDGLNEDETSAYVQQRLSAAGLNGRIPFTDSAIGQLHQVTSGIPRLINLVTENALQAGSRLQRPLIGPEIVLEAAAELSLPDVQQLAQGRKFKVNITSAKSYSAQLSSAVRPTS
jgi:general secretion pathway protein A